MGIIQTLSAQLSNQIAAGEVVERPASIIKECVENSLDAKAQHVSIKISAAGTQRMIIQDDGEGILKEDLVLALARHATSKIKTVEDLFALQTFGFRGEALASIASVSRCRVLSRPAVQSEAWQVYWDPEKKECQLTKASHPIGTTIDIQDLFYTVPVRRKFLKSLKTEWLHIEEVVKRFALSHFDIGFDLFHNEAPRWQLPPAFNENQRIARLAKCMGASFAEKAVWIEAEAIGLRLTGWVASPECARRQADEQHFFVNRRSVRDRMIAYVVKDVLSRHLGEGYYPSFVLYLEIEPENVDINVHPTKQEIRFREPSHVQTFIRTAFETAYQKTATPLQVISPVFQRSDSQSSVQRSFWTPKAERPIEKWQYFLLNKQYAMVVWGENRYLVDCFGCLKEILQNKESSLPLLLPETLLTSVNNHLVQTFLESIGIFSEISKNTIQIKKIPKIFKEIPISLLKQKIIDVVVMLHAVAASRNASCDIMRLDSATTPCIVEQSSGSCDYAQYDGKQEAFFCLLDFQKIFEASTEWQAHWPHLLATHKIVSFSEDSIDWGQFFIAAHVC